MSEERFGEFVLVRRHEQGHVAELVLDRPKAMNAVSTEMARSIAVIKEYGISRSPMTRFRGALRRRWIAWTRSWARPSTSAYAATSRSACS